MENKFSNSSYRIIFSFHHVTTILYLSCKYTHVCFLIPLVNRYSWTLIFVFTCDSLGQMKTLNSLRASLHHILKLLTASYLL